MSSKKKSTGDCARLERENARLRGDLLTLGRRVSHDLRTPLGAISVSLELLKETAAQDGMASEAVRSLAISVDELTRLIKAMSILAKAEGSPAPIEKLNMGEIIWGVRQQWERQAARHGATVTAPDSWPAVAGVPEWIEFVWANFLSNAILHGGPKIRLGWSEENARSRFWIHDNGKGPPAAGRALLFQPFDSLHRPNSTRGLGLSIVHRLVQLQRGECGYDPGSAGGGCFFFTLPNARP
jgi:signal transduction histidine kinase